MTGITLKKIIPFQIGGQINCFYCAIMLIYANYRETDWVDLFIHFFCVKRSVSDRQLEKITDKIAQAKVVR